MLNTFLQRGPRLKHRVVSRKRVVVESCFLGSIVIARPTVAEDANNLSLSIDPLCNFTTYVFYLKVMVPPLLLDLHKLGQNIQGS